MRRITAGALIISAVLMVLAGCQRGPGTTPAGPITFIAAALADVPYEVNTMIDTLLLPEATGGDGEFTYSLEPKVPGLTFDTATRTLSGTPTEHGKYPLTYSATDSQGTVKALSFNVVVLPSFEGTWRWRSPDGWWDNEKDEDGNPYVGYLVDILTFTSERFIYYRAHYLSDGTFIYFWGDSGTWESSENQTIVRINEEGERDSKSYRWADDMRTSLSLEWEFDRQTLFERVENPLPPALTGTWEWVGSSYDKTGHIPGETLTIDPDGTLIFPGELTATWTVDERNYYLNLSSPQDETGNPVFVERIAFAPTDQSNELLMSGYYSEQNRLYGNYYQLWRLVP